jgi:hypothetical protein
VRAHLRWAAPRIVRAVLHRLDDTSRLTPSQRSWLLDDLQEDLAAMVDDAEDRGVSEKTAREMVVARSLVVWLQGDGPPPEADAIDYLERALKAVPRNPGEDELAFRKTYLAAIAELGGDEGVASRLWREPPGGPGEGRGLLDLQGRRVGELMEQRGLTVGGLARRSGIDTVTLVSILFGLEEMRVEELIRLSGALDVSTEDLFPGGPTSAEDERGGIR